MKPDLCVLIHTSRFANYSVSDAMEYVQNMMDYVFSTDDSRKSVQILESSWHLSTLNSGGFLLRYSGDDITSWRQDVGKYGDDVAWAGGTIWIRRGKSKDEMQVRLYFHHEFPMGNPKYQGEKSIFLMIPERLWRGMDPVVFSDLICKTACALNATYAYADVAWLPVTTLHFAYFRSLCENGKELDPEEKLPGIFWGQYVTQKMVEATATIDEIAAQAPCDVKKVYSGADQRGVWLQLSSNPNNASIESRQVLRRYFDRSLYTLSPKLVKERSQIKIIKSIDFDTLPLLPEEKFMLE